MKQKLLLLEDVEDLGRSGDVVEVKPGYARNYLVPRKKAAIATKHTLLIQKKLKEEREKKAVVDKKEAEELAKKIELLTFIKEVKTDPEGRMYGSVSSLDIVDLLSKENIKVTKKNLFIQKL